MIRYPNGKTFVENKEPTTSKKKRTIHNAANRGMSFESDINASNEFYSENHRALITKRPTPINIVKVDYSHGARITDAYFEAQSTTDYNGVYRGRYLDFEAKSCHATSFSFEHIYEHQIKHLDTVKKMGGISFLLIEFVKYNEVFLLEANKLIDLYNILGVSFYH